MFEKLFSYRQIDDLRRENTLNKIARSQHARRSEYPIGVIDDRPFQYEQNLKANGYTIEILGDIRTISEVAPYSIILCDLQGVGRYLNEQSQGAYIIDEIKRNSPDKFVIAYTGGAHDDAVTIRAQSVADFFLKKDQEIEEWRDTLDQIIYELNDPIRVWHRQRDALIDADVPTLDILKLEDAYVKSIKSGDPSAYKSIAQSASVSRDLRAIAQSLIASGIFKAFFG